ncbi:MAG: hypothetical protein HC819_00085 [Cyclobacteriaceae bacterium]|nr:hypothetical protein [Cyclobacteriaceae bacterium]
MIAQLLKEEVQQYIKDHQHDDPFLLSLQAKKNIAEEADFPWKEAIAQIHSLQKAKDKIPYWVETKGIIWPAPLSVEQSSSEIAARHKAGIIDAQSMIDLTGGMGVDTVFFAEKVSKIHYVELRAELADIAKHNFELLGKTNIRVHNLSAEDFLENFNARVDCIYIDPSRRDQSRKVFKIADCVPNLYEILPKCAKISPQVLVKLSPMVDLSLIIRDFNPAKIWVVSIKNEVKEVLCLLEARAGQTQISVVDLAGKAPSLQFDFDPVEENLTQSEFSLPQQYIYEPAAGILKAGAFKLVGKRFGLKKLHVSSHLYTSDQLVPNFPGKVFLLEAQIREDKKEIARYLPEKQANILTRNYPHSPDQLKKKLELKDGGKNYLIGTVLKDGKKILLLCVRV